VRSSRSRSIVLLLDCCYGGAFSQGVAVRDSGDIRVLDSFSAGKLGGGRGRAVITASNAMEYAFEGDQLSPDNRATPSLFTSALVHGLATGEADLDEDGLVSLNELYEYVFDRVREHNPNQTPSRDIEMQGELYLAKSRRRRIRPAPIPADLQAAIEDANAYARLGAVVELRARLRSQNLAVAAGARDALLTIASNDVRLVADAATAALDELTPRLATTLLDFGSVPRGSPSRSLPLKISGPPLALAGTVQASDPWIHWTQVPDGYDVWAEPPSSERVTGELTVGSSPFESHVAVVVAGDDADSRPESPVNSPDPSMEPDLPRENGDTRPPAALSRRQVLLTVGASAAVVVGGSVLTAVVTHRNSPSTTSGTGSVSATPPSPSRSTAVPGASAAITPTAAPPLPAVPVPFVERSIPLQHQPNFVAPSPNGRQLYIANDDNSVSVFDTYTNQATATIPEPGPARFVAFSPDGRFVYVSLWDQEGGKIHAVSVLDTQDNSVKATIGVDTRPFLPAVSPDGRWIYVPDHDTHSVSVIDSRANSVAYKIDVPKNPHYVAFSKDGKHAYTADHESNVVAVIDTATRRVTAQIHVGLAPHSLAQNPKRPQLVNVNWGEATVSVIDTSSNAYKVTNTIEVGTKPLNIQWSPDGRFAYVVDNGSNQLSVISADSWKVTATLQTDKSPNAIAVLPDGSRGYVSNHDSSTLTLIDLARR
jgi:YVTN family beta-propeller protein